MTILVTGSAGHLGEGLMRTLRAAGRAVVGIDIKPSAYTDHVGSIVDRDFVAARMRGVEAVLHTATLHKPHVGTHSYQDFVDTNVTGTLTLLEAARAAGGRAFVFTSTTSTFGAALSPAPDEPAAWITEDVVPVPKNIYGATKTSAETLCELFARKHKLPVIVLKTSRFFPEADDDPDMRGAFGLDNAQANELLYRRGDIADMVSAHLAAIDRAAEIGFGRYIVSATTPFTPDDLAALRQDAAGVVARLFPQSVPLYAKLGWKMFPSVDRVYVNRKAREELGWEPRYTFAHALERLAAGEAFRSVLAGQVGSKGYHAEIFADGPYPVAS